MSKFSNIHSKIDFCISFFPQEFVSRVLAENNPETVPEDRDENRNIFETFVEGVSRSSEMLTIMLLHFWDRKYESIEFLKRVKYTNAIPKKLHDEMIETMLKEIDLIDLSLISDIRKEIEIVNQKNKIKSILTEIQEGTEKLENHSGILSEFFIGCQYYKNLLMFRSNLTDFDAVKDKCFKTMSRLINGEEMIMAINDLSEAFIKAVKNNFIIDKSFKMPNAFCKELIKDDLLTRDISKFECLKPLFGTSYHSECLKPFCWFDTNYPIDDEPFDGTFESLEHLIVSGLKDFA